VEEVAVDEMVEVVLASAAAALEEVAERKAQLQQASFQAAAAGGALEVEVHS
jgi:hypothetical protein